MVYTVDLRNECGFFSNISPKCIRKRENTILTIKFYKIMVSPFPVALRENFGKTKHIYSLNPLYRPRRRNKTVKPFSLQDDKKSDINCKGTQNNCLSNCQSNSLSNSQSKSKSNNLSNSLSKSLLNLPSSLLQKLKWVTTKMRK